MNLKRCTKCKNEKSIEDDFYRHNKYKDGYRSVCKLCFKQCKAEYQKSNKDKQKQYTSDYYKNNSEKVRKATRKSYEKYKELHGKNYWTNRNNRDPLFKLLGNIRARTRGIFARKGLYNSSKLKQYIGCTDQFLFKHIESKFQPGMTWENHGEWHIDHIIPLSSAKTSEELNKLSH